MSHWNKEDLFEFSADLIFVVRLRDYHIVDANPALQRRVGQSVKQLRLRRIHDLVADPKEIVDGWMSQVIESSGGVFESRLILEPGTALPVEIVVTPSPQENLLVMIARETSERRRVEDILKARTNHLRDVIDAAAGPVVVTDPAGNISLVNRLARKLFDRSGPTVLGMPLESVPWWPDSEFVRARIRETIYSATIGNIQRSDEEVILPGGDTRQLDLTFQPIFDIQKEVSHVVVSGVDVTAREALRVGDTLQDLATSKSAMTGEIDQDGKWIRVDEQLSSFLDGDTNELIGKAFWLTISALNDGVSERQFQRLVADDMPMFTTEFRAEEGEFFRMTIGRNSESVSQFSVLLNQPRLTIADDSVAVNARETEQVKASILANVSHEIRTPMNAILGLTSVALEETLEPRVRRWLEVSLGAAKQLMRLLDDLLDLSRLESGKLSFIDSEFDPAEIISNIVEIFQSQANAKDLKLTFVPSSDLPKLLLGDPGRVGQIATNLISNAIKYTHEGKIEVRLWSKAMIGEEAELSLEVKDTGVGIPAATQRTIFQPFERAQETRQIAGLGLGLSIAQELVTAMGGTIELESKIAQGSRFLATMKFLVPNVDNQAKPLKTEDEDQERPLRASLSVLVVDDTEANRFLVDAVLSKRGHVVIPAADGFTALKLIETQEIDVVLMDVNMPDIDGLETTKRLRQWESDSQRSPLPVIALTAHAMIGDREQCLAAGMTGYIPKPIDVRELAIQVENAPLRLDILRHNLEELDSKTEVPIELNIDEALDRLGGDAQLFETMVEILRTDGRKILNELILDLHSDQDAAIRGAHTLKNQAATVGATSVADVCGHIERELRLGVGPSTIEQDLLDLPQLLEDSLEAISNQ